MFENPKD